MKKQIVHTNAKTDEEIIDLYWVRNEEAIPETDRKYGRYLYTIAYNIVRDSRDCEECVNDTYLGTWNRIPPTRPNAFQLFITKIMRNIAVDRFRKNSEKKRVPSEMTVSLRELDECIQPSDSVNEEYLLKETVRILNEYIKQLPEKSEFIFVCRYYYSDQISSIAKMIGKSEDAVYRELRQIREGLRLLLEKEDLI